MPELLVACTDLSALSTYFYKIAIFLFLQASKPPAPKPPSFQSASAGDAKRKQLIIYNYQSRRARSCEPRAVLDPPVHALHACCLRSAHAVHAHALRAWHEMPSIFNALLGGYPQDTDKNTVFIAFTR